MAGMFLNDAFDAEFDRQHRQERPIPSGAISVGKVWGWGLGWLIAGVLLLSLLGKTPMVLALLLCACILLYDAIHKAITLSPVLMALCRWLLYLLGSAAGLRGVTGLAVWGGLALAAYVIGLSYLARKESARGTVQSWACLPLAAPVLLAWVANTGQYRLRAVMLSWLLVAWVIYCLRDTYWTRTVSVGRTVAGLLAGICLVDVVAVDGGTPLMAMAFLLLFATALLLQRYIPAT
jgi:4-hydroxybenzoate polyprenyltransferase